MRHRIAGFAEAMVVLLVVGTLTAVAAPAKASEAFGGDGFSRAAFRDPPADATPAFFWMWNAPLERSKLRADLDEMLAHGVRSVCIHPFPKEFRPGRFPTEMTPPYLSPEYLDVYADVVRYAGTRGMHVWLYDEGGWPSGGACGKVAAEDHRYLRRYIGYGRTGREPLQVREMPANSPEAAEYPSIIELGVVERFLALTHEAYYGKFPAAFGTTVRFAFTDEPAVPYGCAGNLRWCADFAEVFQREKGYDVLPFVPRLIADQRTNDVGLIRVRIDYLDVLAKLFRERYLLPLRSWCRAHGIASAGHLNGENEPNRSADYTYLSIMDSLRAFDVPGVDVIWRQLFPSTPGKAADVLPFPRYASSALHLNGGRYALSESYGIFGDSLSPDQMKWVIDCQLVRGINRFVLAYYAMTNAGAWMTMFEPHFGPVAPLWKNWEAFARYVGRMSELLSQGRPGADVAVFYDTRGFWAGATEADETMRRQYETATALERRGCDYDFVDDTSLAQATVANGTLKVGAMTYRTLVVPTSQRMGDRARMQLESFRRAGGRVVGCGDVDKVPRTCEIACETDALRVMKRVAGRERLYFIVNEDVEGHAARFRLPETGPVVRADPESGRFVDVPRNADGSVTADLPACGSVALIVGAAADEVERIHSCGEWRVLTDGWTFARRMSHVAGKTDFAITRVVEPKAAIALGDWRERVGETFAGCGEYATEFTCDRDCEAELSLGKVCWSASVRLNGRELPKKFFGPFVWRVPLVRGTNRLEVNVVNLLSNALPDEVRDRIARDYPCKANYDRFQRPFDRLNREGGLFGPVRYRVCE